MSYQSHPRKKSNQLKLIFWITFRHNRSLWGGKNCQRRFGKTLPQSWKRCQFLAIKIRTRWCGQNWRTGVYQTQTASQVCQKILFEFGLVFPPKIISSNYPFRMAEDKAHRTMLDAAKLADELRMEQDNTTRYKNSQITCTRHRNLQNIRIQTLQIFCYNFFTWSKVGTIALEKNNLS